jgi:clan AA aspartic protease (TIGR02281 family)
MSGLSNIDPNADTAPRKRVLGWAARMAAILTGLSCLTMVAINLGGLTTATPAAKSNSESRAFFYHAIHERSIPGDPDGHLYINTSFGNDHVRFRLDTAAPTVVLSPEDALAAGVKTRGLTYATTVPTADGDVRVAPVTIKMLTMNEVTFFNVDAAVADHELPDSLLGESFLKRFESYALKDGTLVLRW